MLAKINKFIQLSFSEMIVFLEAYLLLGIMRAGILNLPFKRLTGSLRQQQDPGEIAPLPPEMMTHASAVGNGIKQAAANTPWESACLAQALTAHRMLKRRNIPGFFCLGIKKNTTERDSSKMKAHAWSQCGESIITGEAGADTFSVVSVYTWEIK